MRISKEAQEWSKAQFGGAKLSDKRRVRRVATLAAALATSPGASIPRACETPYEIKAAYNLFRHPEATPENLQAGHRSGVGEVLAEPGTSLLLEDTTEVAWETGRRIEGLGPVGKGGNWDQGFLLHSVLAVRWAGESPRPGKRPPFEVLGIADQQYYIRKAIPEGEDGGDSLARKSRDRESQLWEQAGRHLGPAPVGSRWVRVCDRGADIYEFLKSCFTLGHGFVVRAAQNRSLSEGGRLFETARSLDAMGGFTLFRRQRYRHPARTARLCVASTPVTLKAPQRPGASQGKLSPIACHLVRIWEPEPPEGEEALEWILLVDHSVSTAQAAIEVAEQYASRWVVEDFHKALKTGLGAERLQLEDGHRLFAAVAIMSVVALRLVDMRERLRIDPNADVTASGLTSLELRVLAAYLRRSLETVKDVALAIGRLGGHMNRKGDGMPGLLTLWHGMTKLQALVAGARLGLQLNDLGND